MTSEPVFALPGAQVSNTLNPHECTNVFFVCFLPRLPPCVCSNTHYTVLYSHISCPRIRIHTVLVILFVSPFLSHSLIPRSFTYQPLTRSKFKVVILQSPDFSPQYSLVLEPAVSTLSQVDSYNRMPTISHNQAFVFPI